MGETKLCEYHQGFINGQKQTISGIVATRLNKIILQFNESQIYANQARKQIEDLLSNIRYHDPTVEENNESDDDPDDEPYPDRDVAIL